MNLPEISIFFPWVRTVLILSSFGIIFIFISFVKYRGLRQWHSRYLFLIGFLYFVATLLLANILSFSERIFQVQRYLMAYALISTIFGLFYYMIKELMQIRTYASEYLLILVGLGMTTYLFIDSIKYLWYVIGYLIYPFITGYTIYVIIAFNKYQKILDPKIHYPIDVIFLKSLTIFHSIYILYLASSLPLMGLIPLEVSLLILNLLLIILNIYISFFLYRELIRGKKLMKSV